MDIVFFLFLFVLLICIDKVFWSILVCGCGFGLKVDNYLMIEIKDFLRFLLGWGLNFGLLDECFFC